MIDTNYLFSKIKIDSFGKKKKINVLSIIINGDVSKFIIKRFTRKCILLTILEIVCFGTKSF